MKSVNLLSGLAGDQIATGKERSSQLTRVRDGLLNINDAIQRANEDELQEVVEENLRVLAVLIDTLEDLISEEAETAQRLRDQVMEVNRAIVENLPRPVVVADRDHPAVHKAVEQTSIAQKERCERMFQGRFVCLTPGCNGELWCEYIENERYLVKCERNCRIVWIWARSPKQALERASAPALKPLSEWYESEYPLSLWWPMQNPQEPAHYVGDPRCDDWDNEFYKFFIPHPSYSRTPKEELYDPEDEDLYHYQYQDMTKGEELYDLEDEDLYHYQYQDMNKGEEQCSA